MAAEIRHATIENDHISTLSTYVIHGWPSTRAEVITKYNHTGPLEMK